MFTFLIIVQVCLALGLIGLVLMQHGKGADMGAAFGSGASATVFGAKGSGNFLSRVTSILATLFFVNSILMTIPAINGGHHESKSVADRVTAPITMEKKQAELPPVESATATPSDLPDVPTESPATNDLPEPDQN